MSGGLKTSFAQVWADNLGDWTWPGQATPAVEVVPPAWVPAQPARSEPAFAPSSTPAARAERARLLLIGLLLSALGAVCVGLWLQGRSTSASPAAHPSARAVSPAAAALAKLTALPALKPVSRDASGSAIRKAAYRSVALHGSGSFYVYLPPRFEAHGSARYPVLYLLHGNSQAATAFLDVGLQRTLDRLIAEGLAPPMIAVMIEGQMGSDNWRNIRSRHYESYALEVQQLVDRMLPTIATRAGRAVAGDSMGGFGAMHLALSNPQRFGVVESWIGFFNGLEGQLRIDRPIISKLGLHAFLYGAAQDTIADPSENAPFAAQLRAAGADAHSAVYVGEHSLETVEAHLASMLHFAGRWLPSGAGTRGRG